MNRLIEKYKKEVKPALQAEFKIKNIMAVPKIDKVVINTGIGRLVKEPKAIEKVEKDLMVIAGQKPVYRKAKKSISGFKVREGMDVALSLTLRGRRMYDFIDRLISVALPRSKDFRGIDQKNFDKAGNLNLGIKEQSIFSEVNYETLKDIFSFQITVVTNAGNRDLGIKLLRLMGFPIKK
jgi:large subunit ribosomal protein L5